MRYLAVAAVLASFLVACTDEMAPEEGTGSQSVVVQNRLAANRLAANRLAANRLAAHADHGPSVFQVHGQRGRPVGLGHP